MYVVMDQGCYQVHGPFNTEVEAQNWCDRANYHNPLKSEKWEFYVMEIFPPYKLNSIPRVGLDELPEVEPNLQGEF